MTPEERNLLSNFLRDLEQARASGKDGEADGMIARTLAANPDAAYLLVQHTIVADQSLHAAQARIADLEAELRNAAPAQPSSSFLPSGGGMSGPWGGRPPAPAPVDARPSAFSGGGGLGTFLRSAGTTAAGVAGGELLFSGLSDLFGGHRGGGFFGGGGGGGGYGNGPEEVIVNNYNDDGDDFSDDSNNW